MRAAAAEHLRECRKKGEKIADVSAGGIRSHRVNAAMLKYWLPVLWLASTALLCQKDLLTWRFLLCLPSLLVAAFYLSLAVVRLDNGVLRYQRFLAWTVLPRDEVLSSGVAWHPFIGYIRPKRLVFPWGRLYFVLDPNLNANPFKPGDYALLRCLREEASLVQHRSTAHTAHNRSLELRLVAAGLVGVVTSLMRFFLSANVHQPALQQAPGDRRSSSTALPLRIHELFGSPQVEIALCVVFIVLAVYKRHQPRAWIYAFLAGGSLPFILSRWLG